MILTPSLYLLLNTTLGHKPNMLLREADSTDAIKVPKQDLGAKNFMLNISPPLAQVIATGKCPSKIACKPVRQSECYTAKFSDTFITSHLKELRLVEHHREPI